MVCSLRPNCWPMSLLARALDHGPDDLQFPLRQHLGWLVERVGLAGHFAQVLHDVVHPVMADPELAGHHRLQAPVEELRRRVLENHAARAELKRGDRLVPIDRRGQQHGTDREPELAQLLQSLQPVGPRHGEIEQQDVRLELRDLRDGFDAVPRLADHLEARVGVEQATETVPEDGVVVGDHDANRLLPVTHSASLES